MIANIEARGVLGKRLEEVCEQKGITYRELAAKLNAPVQRLYRIAWGNRTNPGIFDMIRICNALEISLDEFFGTEEVKEFMKTYTRV